MRRRRSVLVLALATLVLAGCGKSQTAPTGSATPPAPGGSGAVPNPASSPTSAAPEHLTTVLPAVAGGSGKGVDTGPFDPGSALGAADVLKVYYAMLAARQYPDAWVWRDERESSAPQTEGTFAAGFDRYASYSAQVGEPGAPQGMAGSMHVAIPVTIHAQLKTGALVNETATAQLLRINDTPTAGDHKMSWRIVRIETRPAR